VANYKMRDANFSRQRYWGEPFPIEYNEDGIPHIVPLDRLPVELPDTQDFQPAAGGKSPLGRMEDWVNIDGGRRETDTMPAVAGSSWYYLRYMDPENDEEFADQKHVNYWESVDLYVGGAEHAVAHLLYARFWHKFLYDIGRVPTTEPFKKLINQGMIQGIIEHILVRKDGEGNVFHCSGMVAPEEMDKYVKLYVHIDYVKDYKASSQTYLDKEGLLEYCRWRKFEDGTFHYHDGQAVLSKNEDGTIKLTVRGAEVKLHTHSEIGKMSKSRYNVINPDDVISFYGTDCFRMYEMFLGPIEQSKPWDTNGIDGVSKFLRKYADLYYVNDHFQISDEEPTPEELKVLHTVIKKVGKDIEGFSFNTGHIGALGEIDCTFCAIYQ